MALWIPPGSFADVYYDTDIHVGQSVSLDDPLPLGDFGGFVQILSVVVIEESIPENPLTLSGIPLRSVEMPIRNEITEIPGSHLSMAREGRYDPTTISFSGVMAEETEELLRTKVDELIDYLSDENGVDVYVWRGRSINARLQNWTSNPAWQGLAGFVTEIEFTMIATGDLPYFTDSEDNIYRTP